jgi:3-methyl-2-oxobutanoate hydroxymethyltransferase
MRTTIFDVQKMKDQGKPIPMVTAYDYTSAQLVDRAGIPIILVGDSLGMVVQGHSSTLPVTLDEMLYHTKAVVRGSTTALIVGDMPFLTYTTIEQALYSAGRFLQEAGAQAVKIEGGQAVTPVLQRLVELGIPVMGHVGFTPQSVNQIGMRVQGKQSDSARRLIDDVVALEQAGAFAVVLELVPAQLAREIQRIVKIPTIGIGAGPWCDGQVQVFHDMMGLYTDFVPRHARRYATLAETAGAALQQYATEVQEGSFPTMEHAATMDEQELQAALKGKA